MKRTSCAAALSILLWCGPGQAQDLSYISGLLAATPAGGWVKASTSIWSSAWPTGSVAVPNAGIAMRGVVDAWSSMDWDSKRGNMLLWGGGHSTYQGNEMYIWQGANGVWTRGSLPSAIQTFPASPDPRTRLIVDDKAPQSCHTYQDNHYLPVNDMFVTLGGPVYNDAGMFRVRDPSGTFLVNAGPWMWDPRKADATKVGGTDGSGYDPTTLGGNMWTNRGGQWADPALGLSHFINNTSASRVENNQDVVYVTYLNGGWRNLYRYVPGDVRNGNGVEQWQLVGSSSYIAAGNQAAGTIDSRHNLYIATAPAYTTVPMYAFVVWNLGTPGPNNVDTPVGLVYADGTPFTITQDFGIEYDAATDQIFMYDGHVGGGVYRTRVKFNADGSVAPQWTVELLPSATAAVPLGNYLNGVLGKFKYIPTLDAYLVLDTFDTNTMDAAVWFYKPVPAAVLVPQTQVSTTSSGLIYSRVSKTYNGTVTVKNIQGTAINGPLQVLFSGVPTNVTVANASGSFLGTPYLTIPGIVSLAPGQSASVTVKLSNPSNGALAVTPAVYAGAFN